MRVITDPNNIANDYDRLTTPGDVIVGREDYIEFSPTFGRVVIIHGNNINLYYKTDQGESTKVGAERVKRDFILHRSIDSQGLPRRII